MAHGSNDPWQITSLGIAGAGLIGASIAARAAEALPGVELRVFDRAYNHAAYVAGMWAKASVAESIEELRSCDVVFVATPVGAVAAAIEALLAGEGPMPVIIDTGSAKQHIVEAVKRAVADISTFVPGHPLAGSHLSGPEAASPDIIDGRTFVLTPTDDTAPEALAKARHVLEALGASIVLADPVQHDALLALTSHLPHVIAYALVEGLGDFPETELRGRLVAGSFKAQTIYAASDPEMWADILIANADAVAHAAGRFASEVERFGQLARAGDKQAIMERIAATRDIRKAIGD